MRERLILLVSTDPLLIKTARGSSEEVPGVRMIQCPGTEEACQSLEENEARLALLHVRPDDAEADVEQFIRTAAAHQCPTVVLSDEYRDHQAVGFLRAGAADYLGLPADLGRLGYLMEALTIRSRPAAPTGGPSATTSPPLSQDLSHFVLDPGMVEMMDHLRRVVAQETTLLFTGETGTGKTRLARLIHELSPRREQPFLVVDCGALSANLIESEMFGHVKGSFTGADRDRTGKFAAAGSGTLLLDEVNSLPPALQSKLLRAVDERVFEPVGSNKMVPLRARLIVASNTPLDQEVAEGRFRADLYFRLNVVGFYLTPLRERQAAVPLLANRFLAEFAARNNRDLLRVVPDAMRMLEQYHWPGNIRELRNVIERAVALCPGPQIEVSDLPEAIRSTRVQLARRPMLRSSASTSTAATVRAPSLMESREEMEILRITEALEKHGNNRLRAAAELGISRMALYKKLHKYGLMGTG
jgi:DNA-binding NtrC family response regulator